MDACSQKEIAFGSLQLPSTEPWDEEQSGGWYQSLATKLNLAWNVQTTSDQAHQAQQAQKVFVRAVCEPWPRRQSSRCQDYDQVETFHEEVSNQSKPRGATPAASQAFVRSRRECQIGPPGRSPCFVRQVSRPRLWCQEDDVLKQ